MPSPARKKTGLYILTLSAIGLILLLLLFFVYKKQKPTPAIKETQNYNVPSTKPDSVSQEENVSFTPSPPSEVKATTPPEKDIILDQDIHVDECERIASNLFDFFHQLEQKEYILAYEIKGPLPDHLNKIIIKLLNNPPVITSESDDLLSIFKNAAHFYRTLGAKDISLIKDILTYEGESLENVIADLYRWSKISNTCKNEHIQFSMPLKKLYEYSCFFLNTLGGQSYLFRRESKTRTLVKYYSLLILDEANQKNINKYNYNLAKMLRQTTEDISDAHFLINRNNYLDRLLQVQVQ